MKIVSLMYFPVGGCFCWLPHKDLGSEAEWNNKTQGALLSKRDEGRKNPFTYKDKKSPFVKAPMKKKISSAFGGDFKRLQYKGFCC